MRISCIYSNKVGTLNNINWEFSWNSNSRSLPVCEIPATLWVNITSILTLVTHTMKCICKQLQCLQCRSLHHRILNIMAFSRRQSSNLIISLKDRCLSMWCIDLCFQTSGMLFVSPGRCTHFKKKGGGGGGGAKRAWCDTRDKRLLWKMLAQDFMIICQTTTFIGWKTSFLNLQEHKRKLLVFLAKILQLQKWCCSRGKAQFRTLILNKSDWPLFQWSWGTVLGYSFFPPLP